MASQKNVITTLVSCLTLVVAATTAGTAFALPADNGPANYYFTQWDYFSDINDADGNGVVTPGGPGTSLWYTEDIDGTVGADWVDTSTGLLTSTTGNLSQGAQGLILGDPDVEVTSGGSGGTAWPDTGMTIAGGFMWMSKAWVGGAGDTLSFYHSPADSDRSFELLISDTGQSVTGIGPIGAVGPYDNASPTSELEEPFWQVNYTPADGGYHVWRNYELLTTTGPILNSALPTQAGENEMTVSLAAGTLGEIDFFAFEDQSFLPDHSYGRFGYSAGTECSAVAECTGGGPVAPSTQFFWNLSGLGDWNDPASWQPGGGPPNSAEHTATFASAISAPSTVVVDTPVTVNRIEFDSANSYAVAGLGSVDLAFDPDDPIDPNDATGDPTIEVFTGNHHFQADVNLTANTDVTAGDDTTLEFHNTIDLGGNDLTIAPATGGLENGVVVLNTSITGSGNVSNSATLSAGLAASLGTGDFSSTGTLDFDITPNSAGLFLVSGTATLDGSVNVDFLDGATPAGTTTLLTAGSPIVLPSGLPSLSFTGASGLSLALSGDSMSLLLNSTSNPVDADGSGFIDGADFLILQRTNPSLIAQWELEYGMPAAAAASGGLAAVPEPTSLGLVLIGLVGLGIRRRR